MFEWIEAHQVMLTLLASLIGGGFVLFQWRKQIGIRRSEFTYQILNELRRNKEITQTSYMIEYGNFDYTPAFHGDRELEQKIDELLSILNYTCYLLKSKSICKRDFSIFRYRVVWILKSQDIQAYLWNLYHWCKFNQTPCSFQYLIDMGIREKLFSNDFLLKQCNHFVDRKYLNF